MITKDPDLLAVDVVVLAGKERAVTRHAGTDARPIMAVAGVESRADADALRDEPILVTRPLLGDDEYWADDLIGCEVVGVGRVVRLLDYPSSEILELDDGSMIPLVHDVIVSVDVANKRIEIREGFLGAS